MVRDRFGLAGEEIDQFVELGDDPGITPELGPAVFVFADPDTMDDMTANQWLRMSDREALDMIAEQTGVAGEDAQRMLKLLRAGTPITAAEFPQIDQIR